MINILWTFLGSETMAKNEKADKQELEATLALAEARLKHYQVQIELLKAKMAFAQNDVDLLRKGQMPKVAAPRCW